MSKTGRFVGVAILVLAGVGVSAWFGWSQFGPGTTAGTQERFRFGNVSIALPPEPSDHSGLIAGADYLPPEDPDKPAGDPVPVIVLLGVPARASLVIDATTGEVLADEIGARHRDAADAAIASLRVESGPAAVWPLADIALAGPRMTHGNISYIQPDPASGIFVLAGSGMGADGAGPFLFVHNGRSRMTIGRTGEIGEDRVLPEDREAFERFAASVSVALDQAP